MTESLSGIIWLVVLLLVNGFFVGAEFAVISARRSQIEPHAAAGNKAAVTTLWAMEHAALMLATSQLGITVCSLVILNVSEPAIHHLLEYPLGYLPLSSDLVGVIAFAIALVLVTFLHVVFGEMVPKNLAFSIPDKAALLLVPPLVAISKIFKPLIWGLNATANGVLRLFRVTPQDEANSTYTLDEIATIVEQSKQEGALEDTTGTLSSVFEFTEKTVAQVEVPLQEIVPLPLDVTPAGVQEAVKKHGYSRYILVDSHGEPVEYIHMKDVMDLTGSSFNMPLPEGRRRLLASIPRTAELEEALALMRQKGEHIAKTTDDRGTTIGLLFLEDILEILIGEVSDGKVA